MTTSPPSATTASAKISYSSLRKEYLRSLLPRTVNFQRALAIVAIICGILSLIPTIGVTGSLALRSVSLLMVGAQLVDSLKGEDFKQILLRILRIAIVSLGLAGLITQNFTMMTAAIVADSIFQAMSSVHACSRKDYFKGATHLSMMLIDSFAMIGFITGMWQFIVTAASLNALVMLGFGAQVSYKAVKAKDWAGIFDAICCVGLSALSVASAIRAGELAHWSVTKWHYTITNNKDVDLIIYDKHGNVVAVLKPGESISFSLTPDQGGAKYINYKYEGSSKEFVLKYSDFDKEKIVTQNPMDLKDFPTVPVGGSTLANFEGVEKQKATLKINKELLKKLRSFLYVPPRPIVKGNLMRKKGGDIAFRNSENGKKYTFSYEIVSQHIDFLKCKADFNFQQPSGQSSAVKEKEYILEIEKNSFKLLMDFLVNGNLQNLNRHKETTLLDLYQIGSYLGIGRVEDLCMSEIARRVVHSEWWDTELLKAYQNSGQALSQLVALVDF